MDIKRAVKRRVFLSWASPVVASITLPLHAQTSSCEGPPLLTVGTAPKCSGDPPVGTSDIEVIAPGTWPLTIQDIVVTTTDPKSTLSLPSFPTTITNVSGTTMVWTGPASDALSCLPLASISVVISYTCGDGVAVFTETYDISQLLIASL